MSQVVRVPPFLAAAQTPRAQTPPTPAQLVPPQARACPGTALCAWVCETPTQVEPSPGMAQGGLWRHEGVLAGTPVQADPVKTLHREASCRRAWEPLHPQCFPPQVSPR